MTDPSSSRFPDIEADDGHHIELRVWPTEEPSRALIQVMHGLAEHADRYDRFARACNARAYAVVAHNHRGHGGQSAPHDLGHFADVEGWSKLIDDVKCVFDETKKQYPAVPYILFGHSMGSYVAQSFVMREAPELDGLILSGSTWPNRTGVRIARWLAWIATAVRGPRVAGTVFDNMSFGQFNKRFAPNRTEFDWLSRDEEEVDRYVADALCGAPASSRLWYDLFGALLEISDAKSLVKVPGSLPLLITGGVFDPVGGAKALSRLAAEYRASGHQNVALKLYADARHEMLNEINRDDVTADILGWMDRVLRFDPTT